VADDRIEDRYDLWLSRIVRTLAALLGLVVFMFEVVKGKSVEFALVAVGLMGLPFGRAVQRFLEWVTTLRPQPDQEDRG
jgi:hypothetical protein